jgi:2-amino-4-hydroxy-6-hydroxymethyldihydropteridine diphosphokinase
MRAVVGLGGNVGEPDAIARRFDAALAAIGGVVRRSSLWRTAPVGPVTAQAPFLNAVAEVEAPEATPSAFLARLLAVEAAHGRDRARETPKGPRTLDLDLLLWGAAALDDPGPPRAIVPHPRLARRAFALGPLVEIAGPDLVVPGPDGGRAGDLLAAALADPAQHIQKV